MSDTWICSACGNQNQSEDGWVCTCTHEFCDRCRVQKPKGRRRRQRESQAVGGQSRASARSRLHVPTDVTAFPQAQGVELCLAPEGLFYDTNVPAIGSDVHDGGAVPPLTPNRRPQSVPGWFCCSCNGFNNSNTNKTTQCSCCNKHTKCLSCRDKY